MREEPFPRSVEFVRGESVVGNVNSKKETEHTATAPLLLYTIPSCGGEFCGGRVARWVPSAVGCVDDDEGECGLVLFRSVGWLLPISKCATFLCEYDNQPTRTVRYELWIAVL